MVFGGFEDADLKNTTKNNSKILIIKLYIINRDNNNLTHSTHSTHYVANYL